MNKCFPYDYNTLLIIKEMEVCLGVENRDIYRMNYNELIGYIDKLALMFPIN